MSTRIKLTLGQIAACDERELPVFMIALRKLRRLPLGKEAYGVGKTIRIIEQEFADYTEAYAAIVKQHGDEVAPGSWKVRTENIEQAGAEIKELRAKDFEVYLDHKIKLPDTGAIADQLKLLSQTIMASAATAQPDQILPAAQMLSGIVNEWWASVLTPEDAMQLDPLIME